MFAAEMAVSSASGVRLHYVEDGAGDPPLVFVHGWCCDHSYFAPQFDYFKVAHRAVSLDLRGCGESDKPGSGYDIPTLADDVAALCRELDLKKPVVIGHSLGGMIGIELAGRHPSVAGAVVAVDPGPIAILPETRALFEAFIAGLEGPDSAAVREAYVGDMFLATDDSERKRRIVSTMCSAPLRMAIDNLRGVITWNGVGALTLCTAPLLVLMNSTGGSNDPARLLALKSDVQIGVTVGAGHFIQLEVPDQVNAMIDRFLRTQVAKN